MNGKMAKKIRQVMRVSARDANVEFMRQIIKLSFRNRLRLCWSILFRMSL